MLFLPDKSHLASVLVLAETAVCA